MRLLLLATGGTIAMHPGRPGRGAFLTGAELLDTVPPEVAKGVEVEDVVAAPSWDLDTGTMLEVAYRVRRAVSEDGFTGVVVTHGTDTVEETAFLTDLLAGPAAALGGIVFTGAMRPAHALSCDGPGNLAASLAAAADPVLRGAGPVVCLNDELHAARWVRKVDATTVAAFDSAPYPLLGRVRDGKVQPLAPWPPRPPEPVGDPEPAVALITVYPGIGPEQLTAVVDAGARGIVLEGTGLENVPVSLFTTISDLGDWGIPVVVASRCRVPGTPMAVGRPLVDDSALAATVGAIGARGLPAVKARYALMAALGTGRESSRTVDGVRAWFARLRHHPRDPD
jgi:L-asparaginase